jgi:simple sugar transport system ATP-binding protein
VSAPLLEVRDVWKFFGHVVALRGVSARVDAGEVTCILGDNGAGKSTLIKILCGVFPPDRGQYLIDGQEAHFASPREALQAGIATVYQDLALVPLMSIWRNFFCGSEPQRRWGPFRGFDVALARRTAREEMAKMGIDLRDVDQPVGEMSGGERQSVAIARAIYFGARVLILDEPTAALGVRQAGVVLRYIIQARDRGLAVILITHNPNHAYPVGDRFVLLNRGEQRGDFHKGEIGLADLTQLMAGGEELAQLSRELEGALSGAAPGGGKAGGGSAARDLPSP